MSKLRRLFTPNRSADRCRLVPEVSRLWLAIGLQDVVHDDKDDSLAVPDFEENLKK